MRIILVTFILIHTLLLAQESSKISVKKENIKSIDYFGKVLSPEDENSYTKALEKFNHKNYKAAYKAFDALFFKHLDDVNINFYLGRSAFELGNYEEAMSAYERILLLHPESIRVRLELARTHYNMKMYESSEVEFQAILKNPDLPFIVREKVQRYLDAIENLKKKSFFKTMVMATYAYDTNYNTASIENKLNIANINFPNNTKPIGDQFHQEMINLTNRYDVGVRGGFEIYNNVMLFSKNYLHHDDRDVIFFNYTPSLQYTYNNSIFSFGLLYEHLVYATQHYMNSYGFTPKYTYSFNNGLNANFYYKQKYMRYIQTSNYKRNATLYETGVSIQKSFTTQTMLSFGINAEAQRAQHFSQAKNLDVESNSLGFNFLAMQVLPFHFNAKFQMQMRQSNYLHTNLDQTKRDERFSSYNTTLSYKAYKGLLINVNWNFSKNDSNQDPYIYDKDVFSCNMIYNF